MNNSIIESSKHIDKRPCLHSRKLFNLIDNHESHDELEYLENHLYECSSCQKYYAKLLQLKESMERNIPEQIVDKRINESFAVEVRELFANLKLKVNYSEKKSKINKVLSFFRA